MSGYAVPVYLPRKRRIISPGEWLREKIVEQKRERDSVIALASSLQSAAGGISSSTPLSVAYSLNCTPGSTFICACYWNDTAVTATVADSVNGSWTPIGSSAIGPGGMAGFRAQMFMFTGNTSAVKPSVTMTAAGSVTSKGMAIEEVSGLMVVEGTASQSGATANASNHGFTATKTPALSTDAAFAFWIAANQVTGVAAPFTERQNTNFQTNSFADDMSLSAGVGVACDFTVGNANEEGIVGIVILTPQGAAASDPIVPRQMLEAREIGPF